MHAQSLRALQSQKKNTIRPHELTLVTRRSLKYSRFWRHILVSKRGLHLGHTECYPSDTRTSLDPGLRYPLITWLKHQSTLQVYTRLSCCRKEYNAFAGAATTGLAL